MKSPDRDAADLVTRLQNANALHDVLTPLCREAASELATLCRRVADLEEALRAIAGQSVYEDDDYRIQLQDTIDAAHEVATAALSPPTRKE